MTKIDIFSGFLGAGKTTLIKKLIQEAYQGEKLVLIENEFGEIGIDGGFLQDAGVEITEMNSGCICCSLVGDFGQALEQVLFQFHPDRILIEPSGVGKLSDVIGAVQRLDNHEIVLNAFVTVADATKCKIYMKNFGEFFNNQIEHAAAIVLSRTSGMNEKKLLDTVALLREHNANAPIITTPWEELDGKTILETMENKDTLKEELAHLAAEQAAHDKSHIITTMSMTMNTITTTMKRPTNMNTGTKNIITMTMSTIITTVLVPAGMTMMPMRSSSAGGQKLPANTQRRKSLVRCMHWARKQTMAWFSAPRESCPARMAPGSTSTMCLESKIFAAVPPALPVVCASLVLN